MEEARAEEAAAKAEEAARAEEEEARVEEARVEAALPEESASSRKGRHGGDTWRLPLVSRCG